MRFRFPIDGAVSMAKMERVIIDGEDGIKLPETPDEKYTSAVLIDEISEGKTIWLLCSKDYIEYEIAVAVEINDTTYTAQDFENMSVGTLFEILKNIEYREYE